MKSKFKSRKSWRERLEKPREAKLVKVPPKMSRFGTGMMLIPTPKVVNDLIRKVPKGKLLTVGEMRRKLAADFAADVTCPLTTGIFVRIAAEAAEEDRLNNRQKVTPYWRVIKNDGSLNPKFPGGVAQQTRYLRSEGFLVSPNGRKPPIVKEFERKLFKLK